MSRQTIQTSSSHDVDAARSELKAALYELQLREARKHFLPYATFVDQTYQTPWHIRRTAEHLEAVASGDISRLIVVFPPRHSKTTTVSKLFPAWYMGKYPDRQIIHVSYGKDMADDFGYGVRRTMVSDEHIDVFPASQLKADSKAVGLFRTESEGIYKASGILGAITGRGGHLILIDDAHKNAKEASRLERREDVWRAWQNDIYSRRMEPNAIIVIGTRWHDDDFIGRLLNEEDGDDWRLLHFPAILDEDTEDARALWPEAYSLDYHLQTKNNNTQRMFDCIYQGNPTPEEGIYFQREWLIYGVPPPLDQMRIYGASDYAVSEGEGDYTVHVVVGIDPADRLWILDLWRRQTTSDRWISAFIDLVQRWKPLQWGEEQGQILKGVGPFLERELRRRDASVWRKQFVSATDKVQRAQSIIARASSRGLYIPRAAPWASHVETELPRFPAGATDDIVDALGIIGRMEDEMEPGTFAPVPVGPTPEERMMGTGMTLDEEWKLGEKQQMGGGW